MGENIRCAHCGKIQENHQAGTLACPVGKFSKTGYANYADTVFTPRTEKTERKVACSCVCKVCKSDDKRYFPPYASNVPRCRNGCGYLEPKPKVAPKAVDLKPKRRRKTRESVYAPPTL